MSDLRPRSNSELLDAAFEIYRRHFVVLMAITVFAAIPWAISSFFAQSATFTHSPDDFMMSALVRFSGAFLAPFIEGAVAITVSDAYLGKPVEFERIIRETFRQPGRLFIAMCAKWILFIFGLFLLIVPGFIVFKRYFAVPMTVLFEDNKAGDAIARSRELSNGNGARIFTLIGGVYFFQIIVTAVLGQTVLSLSNGPVAVILQTAIATVIYPFTVVVMTLLYYDIRIRREGYDIELMSQALDAAAPPLRPAS
jgi:hypothetical protein